MLEFTYDTYFRDFTKPFTRRKFLKLSALENNLVHILRNTPGERVTKNWLKRRGKKRSYILRGVKEENLMSGDVKVTITTIHVDTVAPTHDAMKE